MHHALLNELKTSSATLLNGCKSPAMDGTILFTPDGISSYDALWTRDFSYMVENAGDLITDNEIIDAVNYIIRHRRKDGWMPDRTYADETTAYAAGVVEAPIGKANLDNTPFLIFIVHSLSSRLDTTTMSFYVNAWMPLLIQGLEIIPKSNLGLVYNDPEDPHSPYGFTDTVAKTGNLFMESLLYWQAIQYLLELGKKYSYPLPKHFSEEKSMIESNISTLFSSEHQAFLAADKDCKQLDIWGNIYALYINFPLSENIRSSIANYLIDHYSDYVLHGQVRHLPKGEYWDRLLIEISPEEYQNGAYWATASGWLIIVLSKYDKSLSEKTLHDVTEYFRNEGSFECMNTGYQKLNSFVVSTTNVYGAAKLLYHEI